MNDLLNVESYRLLRKHRNNDKLISRSPEFFIRYAVSITKVYYVTIFSLIYIFLLC